MTAVATREWIKARIPAAERVKYMSGTDDFINDATIERDLAANKKADTARVRDIIRKSLEIQTLSPAETAALLSVTDPSLVSEMEEAALSIKKKVYDNRIVTFAPLYTSTVCVNNCQYCGFRSENAQIRRGVLTQEQVRRETEVLAGDIGHKRLIAVYGEHPSSDTDYIAETLRTIYSVRMKPTPLRLCVLRAWFLCRDAASGSTPRRSPRIPLPKGLRPVRAQPGPSRISPQYAALAPGQKIKFTAGNTGGAQTEWMVNGAVGGNSTTGTVDSSGNYTAPASVTQSENVTVTVALTSSAQQNSATAAVAIILPAQVACPPFTGNPQVASYSIYLPAPGKVSVEFGKTTDYGLNTWPRGQRLQPPSRAGFRRKFTLQACWGTPSTTCADR